MYGNLLQVSFTGVVHNNYRFTRINPNNVIIEVRPGEKEETIIYPLILNFFKNDYEIPRTFVNLIYLMPTIVR